jgi:hypothetical protein
MTNNTKFTPGPWYSAPNGEVYRRPYTDLYEFGGDVAGDVPIAITYLGNSDWENKYPRTANANLIATSPELYAELERSHALLDNLRQMYKLTDVTQSVIGIQRAANSRVMAKARGE